MCTCPHSGDRLSLNPFYKCNRQLVEVCEKTRQMSNGSKIKTDAKQIRNAAGCLRVLYIGGFQIARIDASCQAGENPSQHLHAIPELRRHRCELSFLGPERGVLGLNFAAWRALASNKADIVVAHGLREVRILALLRKLRVLKKPLVAFVHSFSPSKLNAFIAAGADCLLALNAAAAANLKRCGVPSERVIDFPFGADAEFYRPTERAPLHMLSVGVSGRDFDTLLEAASHVNVKLIVVGSLSPEQRARVPANVEILSEGSYDLPFSKLLALYDSAHFVVVTHHGTSHPFGVNALVEAMAMAKAVVLTDGEGIDIDPVALDFGLKVPVHDVDALTAAMRKLLAEKESTVQMGKKARHWVESDFNTRAMADRIYKALLGTLK